MLGMQTLGHGWRRMASDTPRMWRFDKRLQVIAHDLAHGGGKVDGMGDLDLHAASRSGHRSFGTDQPQAGLGGGREIGPAADFENAAA